MMSAQHLLMLDWVLLVLLVQVPGTESGLSIEEKYLEFAPQWVMPERMESRVSVGSAGTVKFRCQAVGNPIPTLSWFKNGIKITRKQRLGGYKIRDHAGSLAMDSVIPSDRGNYTCVVENKHGRLQHTYQLHLDDFTSYPPVLAPGLPVDQTAVVGGNVSFECNVVSEVWVQLQWRKHFKVNGSSFGPDGLPYFTTLKSVSSTGGSDVLTLRNVALEDAGHYICLVANSVGFAHRTAELTVIDAPASKQTQEVVTPTNQTALVGSDVSLECQLTAETPTHIKWLKHVTVDGRKPEVKVLKTSVKDGGRDVLTLEKVALEDAGEYICVAGNSDGVSYQSVWLTVISGQTPDPAGNQNLQQVVKP